jgi:hypothetical protein
MSPPASTHRDEYEPTARGRRAPVRLYVIAMLAAFVLPAAVVYGHGPEGLGTARPMVEAAQSLTIGDLRVQRRAAGGRVRGSVAVGPAGAALEVVVRRGAKRVGHTTLTASAGARTSFSARVDRASRARLRRAGHLDLRVDVTASAPGTRVSTSTTARVTR